MLCVDVKKLAITWLIIGTSLAYRKYKKLTDCEMCNYVYADDDIFEYKLASTENVTDGVVSYVLEVTSIKWLDETFVTQPIWKHSMYVHVPNNLKHESVAFLVISGEKNNDIPVPASFRDVVHTANLAKSSQTITAVGFQIPPDPITYKIINKTLTSDDAMMFSHLLYRNMQASSVTFTMEAGMTKAGKRMMDAVQQFTKTLGKNVEKFFLNGISKRGTPVWILGAIDKRVIGIAPALQTMLNLVPNTYHIYKTLNGWPIYLVTMVKMGALSYTETEEYRKLYDLIDPYSYKEYLHIPKLIIAAGSDDAFNVDNTHLWLKDLPRKERYFWILENSGHFMHHFAAYAEYWTGLEAFYISVIKNQQRPRIRWTKKIHNNRGKIAVVSDKKPSYASVFRANSSSPHRRDFRRFTFCPVGCPPTFKLCGTCPPIPMKDHSDLWKEEEIPISNFWRTKKGKYKYVVKENIPNEGYFGFYIKLRYKRSKDTLVFTTEVLTLPDTYPVDTPCLGTACESAPIR